MVILSFFSLLFSCFFQFEIVYQAKKLSNNCNRFPEGSGLQRDISIDFNQTGGINETKNWRRQPVIE